MSYRSLVLAVAAFSSMHIASADCQRPCRHLVGSSLFVEERLPHAGQIKLCNSDCNQNRAVIWSFGQLGHDACQPKSVVASPGPSSHRRVGALTRSAPCLISASG
jgi:hypothetical protein